MSLTGNLEKMKNRMDITIERYVASNANSLQTYMQNNYKWTPHSHRANESMSATYKKTEEGYEIALAYGVDYGVYLELAHEKRFALTHPTKREKGPAIIAGFTNLLNYLSKDL